MTTPAARILLLCITLASWLLEADVLVANAAPINNVAVQWNLLANRLYCQSSGLLFEPNIILAQLGLAQLHAVLALKGSGTGQSEAGVAYASHTILSNYYNFQQDLSIDPLLATQVKALNLSRWQKKLAKQLGEAVALSLLRKRNLGREFSLESVKEALDARANNLIPGLYRYLNNTQDGRDEAYFIFHNIAISQPYVVPDPLKFISEHLSQYKPPKVPSPEWDYQYDKVKDIGRIDWKGRTLEMDLTASLLSCTRLNASYCSSSSLMSAVARAVLPRDASLHDTVLAFAKTSVALYDALVVLTNLQYGFWFWRPQSAFRAGDSHHKPIPNWTPYRPTPPHAEYPSGTVTLTSAAATMLERILGEKNIVPFQVSGGGVFAPACGSVAGIVVGDSRHYNSVADVVKESQLARMYAGAHYEISVKHAAEVGAKVAEYVDQHWADSTPSGVRPDATYLDVAAELPKKARDWRPLVLEF